MAFVEFLTVIDDYFALVEAKLPALPRRSKTAAVDCRYQLHLWQKFIDWHPKFIPSRDLDTECIKIERVLAFGAVWARSAKNCCCFCHNGELYEVSA